MIILRSETHYQQAYVYKLIASNRVLELNRIFDSILLESNLKNEFKKSN